MFENYPTTIQGPDGPLLVQFGEANGDQLVQCHELAGLAFGQPLSKADFIERENFMNDLAVKYGGVYWWRIWCVFLVDNPLQVLASCKTIRRDLLVKACSTAKPRDEKGYCISSVVVDATYRGVGLGAFLLASVKRWMDTDGAAVMSMLYSSKEGFYLKYGWFPVAAPELSLTVALSFSKIGSCHLELPETTVLHSKDIDLLCARDINALRLEFTQRAVPEGKTSITVLPTSELIRWLHGRAEFFALKLFNKPIPNKGSICGKDNWVYWHHDFRKKCLYIQRVRSFAQDRQERIHSLAALILHACHEAEAWALSSVVIWDANPEVYEACEKLHGLARGINATLVEKRRETVSLRHCDYEDVGLLDFHLNDHFAWN